MKVNEKIRPIIGLEASKYLKNRLELKRRIVAGNDAKIEFGNFMALYTKYEENETTVTIDGNKKISVEEVAKMLKKVLVEHRSNQVFLSDADIEELLGYVRESIEKCGLEEDDVEYSENGFIRLTLDALEDHFREQQDVNSEKMARVQSFNRFFHLGDTVGFDNRLGGVIKCESEKENFDGGKFFIRTQDYERVCRIDRDGNDLVIPGALEREVVAILDELYLGILNAKDFSTGSDDVLGVFRKFEENGISKAQALTYDGRIYEVTDGMEEGKVSLEMPLREVLERNGLSFAIQEVYVNRDFNRLVRIYNNSVNYSLEDKKQIDEATEAAVEWWASSLAFPTFFNGDTSKMGAMLSVLGMMEASEVPAPSAEKIELFKMYLRDLVKKNMYSIPGGFYLRTDYGPQGELLEAVQKAEIDVRFPWKTTMSLNKDVVKVNGTDIYRAANMDMNDGSAGPQF